MKAVSEQDFLQDVTPDPTKSCGPYKLKPQTQCSLSRRIKQDVPSVFNTGNHDTIGMIVINGDGHMVAGTSTNGANHKIPG